MDKFEFRHLARMHEECCLIVSSDMFRARRETWGGEADVVLLLILLRDLLVALDNAGHRIAFDGECPDGEDVTDHIRQARNAACHVRSGHHEVPGEAQVWARLIVIAGKDPPIKTDDFNFECDYADDTAIFFGNRRIYLGRHIVRSLNEARTELLTLAKQHDVPSNQLRLPELGKRN